MHNVPAVFIFLVLVTAGFNLEPMLLITSAEAFPDAPANTTTPLTGDWQPVGKPLVFKERSLYGRIDGGAELFFEFGFDDLTVQTWQSGEASLEVETFRMESPAAALGIYLAKCGREKPVTGVAARNTGNRFQLLMVKRDNYYQINNHSGDKKLESVMAALAQELVAGEPQDPALPIWEHLPTENRVAGSERLIRGPFALQPVYEFGSGDVLQLDGQLFGALADYCDESGTEYTLIVIPYPDGAKATAAFESLRANLDPYLEVMDQGTSGFVWRDFQDQFGRASVASNLLSLIFHLETQPALQE